MAFTSIAALVGGAEASATLVLGAMAEIGTTMSIVGAVTGNKDLLKIGGVLGLVGGVGGLVNGAVGAAGGAAAESATSGLGEAVDATGGLDTAVSGASGASAGVGAGIDATGGLDTAIPGQTSGLSDATATMGAGPAPTADSLTPDQSILSQAQGTPPATPTPSATTGPASDVINSPTTQPLDNTTMRNPDGTRINNPSAYTQDNSSSSYFTSKTPPIGANDFIGQIMNWVKGNPQVANGLLQIGGGALKGMNDRQMFDQKLAQDQQQFQTRFGHGNEVAAIKPMSLIQSARA